MSIDPATDQEAKRFVVRQEPDRVERRPVGMGAVLASVGIVVSLGASALFIRASDREPTLPVVAPSPQSTVERSLVLGTERGLALRAEQRAAGGRYGWVDRDAGIATIPIERAMDIVGLDPTDGGLRR